MRNQDQLLHFRMYRNYPKIIETQEQKPIDPNKDILGQKKAYNVLMVQIWNSEIYIYFPSNHFCQHHFNQLQISLSQVYQHNLSK